MSPRSKHSVNANKGICKWSSQETSRLIASIKFQLEERDPYIYSRRLNHLDWEKIRIPFKSIEECKNQLKTIIKKIHRIRTLAEILSEVDVECFDFSLSHNIKSKIKQNVSDRTDSSHSKRLSYAKNQFKPKQSLLTPFMLFAESSNTKDTNKYALKCRYNQLSDSEKTFWIRQLITSTSKNDKVQECLTKDESFLLEKERKRKMTDDVAVFKTKSKIRKTDFSLLGKPIEPQSPAAEEIVVLIENNDCTQGVETEMEIPSVNETIPLVEQDIEDIVDIETTEIRDQLILDERTDETECINQEGDVDTSTMPEQLKLEEYSDFHNNTNQEIREWPVPVYARFKTLCSGFLSRIKSWAN